LASLHDLDSSCRGELEAKLSLSESSIKTLSCQLNELSRSSDSSLRDILKRLDKAEVPTAQTKKGPLTNTPQPATLSK
jgi:hypothetical protein